MPAKRKSGYGRGASSKAAGPSKAGPATCAKGGKGSPAASKLGLRGPGAGARPFPGGRDGGSVRRPRAEGPASLVGYPPPLPAPAGEDEAPARAAPRAWDGR